MCACEGETARLKCSSKRNTITIQSAFYGRIVNGTHLCPYPNHGPREKANTNTACNATSEEIIARVKQLCDNYTSCDVSATNSEFGDSCPNTYKYLRITYTCKFNEPYFAGKL